MLTPTEELWSAISGTNKDYSKAISIIKLHPNENLINSTNNNSHSILMIALAAKEISKEFVEFILSHQAFNLSYSKGTISSNIESLITAAEPDFINLVKNNPAMFQIEPKLAYEKAAESVKLSERAYESRKQKDPTAENTLKAEARLNNLKLILATLRDTTIRHAFATNNYLLFSRLEAAGASLGEPLLDGTYPAEILKDDPAMFNPTVKLGYELAHESYKCADAKYQEKKKANPSDNETKQLEASVKKLQAIRATILDKTKRHAITNNDDAEIFKRIQASGVSPFDEFLDGTLPGMIMKPSTHPRIAHWSKTRMAGETPKISTNSNAFYLLQELRAEQRALQDAQTKALADVHRRGAERLTEIADTFAAKI